MGSMPGFGDSATWGPCVDPRDPRYDDSAEEALENYIELSLEDIEDSVKAAGDTLDDLNRENIEYQVGEIRKMLAVGRLESARKALDKIEVPA